MSAVLSSYHLACSHTVICLWPSHHTGPQAGRAVAGPHPPRVPPPGTPPSLLTPSTALSHHSSLAPHPSPLAPPSPHAFALVEQEVLNPYLPPLVPLITTCVEDDWYKIIAEALRVVGVVITIIRPIDKASGMFKGVRPPALQTHEQKSTHSSVGLAIVKPTSP